MNKKQIGLFFFLCYIPLFIIACQQDETQSNREQNSNPHDQSTVISQHLADEVKKKVEELEKVDEVRVVSYRGNVYITLTVSGFQRFFLKQIREDAHRLAKETKNVKEVHVSTDKKINMELTKIEEQLKKGVITEKELDKKLLKIEGDMKG